ncbi:MAG: hypothetical protein JWM47_1912 [Acidimicrobiales bacterium]|nr:hypothetical protein [Acidimicrobiales bacterium]
MGRVRPVSPRRSFPRSRLPLHRRPFADPAAFRRWLLVAALAAATAGLTGRLVARAEATQARWGATAMVLVVDRPLRAGTPLAAATSEAHWPVALVPPGALRSLPTRAVAAGPVATGTAVTPTILAPRRHHGPVGQRIAVPTGDTRLPLRVGDQVDVWATVDPSLAGQALATRRVASRATVTAVPGGTVVVAVTPAEVQGVAEAVALATITLVAVG